MNDKIIQPAKAVLPSFDRYTSKIKSIWDTYILTNNGSLLHEFENKLKEHEDVDNCSLFVNGHTALNIAIKALDLTGEVITTPFTFASTIHTITSNGLTPVFCDIDIETFNIDASKIENLITDKTSAIIGVHLFGVPCDVNAINKIAQKHGVKIIYDAAQSFGVRVDGKSIGSYGDMTMFSFHATKVLNSIEGGALMYNDAKYTYKLDLLRNFGISYGDGDIEIELVGMNGKMNEFQAAMGILNLENVNEEIKKRKSIARMYKDGLAKKSCVRTLNYLPNIEYNYSYFPILIEEDKFCESRDRLHLRLKENGILTRKLYSKLCPDYECYRGMNYHADIPVARYAANNILDLPIYGALTAVDIEYILSVINS